MNLLKALSRSTTADRTFLKNTHLPVRVSFNSLRYSRQRKGDTVAVVKSPIEPGQLGHVRFRGVRWRACSDGMQLIPEGTQVKVLGRRANILVVEPLEKQAFSEPSSNSLEAAAVTP